MSWPHARPSLPRSAFTVEYSDKLAADADGPDIAIATDNDHGIVRFFIAGGGGGSTVLPQMKVNAVASTNYRRTAYTSYGAATGTDTSLFPAEATQQPKTTPAAFLLYWVWIRPDSNGGFGGHGREAYTTNFASVNAVIYDKNMGLATAATWTNLDWTQQSGNLAQNSVFGMESVKA